MIGPSPAAIVFGKTIGAILRWGWIVFIVVLLVLGVSGLVPWKTVLMIGAVGGAAILISPFVLGAVGALDSRYGPKKPPDEPPHEPPHE
jgi:hypothetical protein